MLISNASCDGQASERRGYTYETQGPEDDAVHDQPGLFTKSRNLLLLTKTHVLGKGGQHIFHGRSAQTGQYHNHEEDEIDIVKPRAILVRPVVEFLQGEEFGGVGLGAREEVVGAEKEGQQVEGEPWKGSMSAVILVSLDQP